MLFSKKLWGIEMQVIALRSEMIVDDIQQHHQSTMMSALYQTLEIFWSTVNTVWCKQQGAVITPITLTRKIGYGHEFDSCHTEPGQIIQFLLDGRKSPFGREGADMYFVDHGLLPRPAIPGIILPVEC